MMIPLKKAVKNVIGKGKLRLDMNEAPFYIYEDIAWRAFKKKIKVFHYYNEEWVKIPFYYFENHTFKKFNYFTDDLDETELDFDPFMKTEHLDIELYDLRDSAKMIARTYPDYKIYKDIAIKKSSAVYYKLHFWCKHFLYFTWTKIKPLVVKKKKDANPFLDRANAHLKETIIPDMIKNKIETGEFWGKENEIT